MLSQFFATSPQAASGSVANQDGLSMTCTTFSPNSQQEDQTIMSSPSPSSINSANSPSAPLFSPVESSLDSQTSSSSSSSSTADEDESQSISAPSVPVPMVPPVLSYKLVSDNIDKTIRPRHNYED